MNSDFLKRTESCFRDDTPPCVAVCPLRVDVPKMLSKLQKERFSNAFRDFRNAVLFPEIVSRLCPGYCEGTCVRKEKDSALAVRTLEQQLVALSRDTAPSRFNVPQKQGSIAIIGGGLSGLGCALRLSARNYHVTVYEQHAKLGGSLNGTLPEELYLAEIQREFSNVPCQFEMNRTIRDLSEIQADAIYVATGSGGEDFGLKPTADLQALGTGRPGVFMGGQLLDVAPIPALAHGMRASHSIEKYLKVGLMDGMPETYRNIPVNPRFYNLPVPEALPVPADADIAQRTRLEASRCGSCKCSFCNDSCDMMEEFNKYPKRIIMDAVSSFQPVELNARIGSRLVHSCNQCGLCQQECPEGIDTGDAILQTRRHLNSDGAMAPPFHDYWLRDMAHALGEECYLALAPGGTGTKYAFFPGCQLGASDPRYVLKTLEHLKGALGDVGLLYGCCGIPAEWAGDDALFQSVSRQILGSWEEMGRPVLIFACTSCQKTFQRYHPQVEALSLYQVLAETDDAPIADGGEITLFDPCAGRYEPVAGESVRALLQNRGVTVRELSHNKERAQCCGFGGHIYTANSKLTQKIVQQRTGESDLPYVAYCANCRDAFAAAGKPCRHILDVIFSLNDSLRQPPHLSQRKKNRARIKHQLLHGDAGPTPAPQPCKVEISQALYRKMDELLVLTEEVEAIIQAGEDSGQKLVTIDSQHFISQGPSGVLTCWVEYEVLPTGYRLHNLYTHRLGLKKQQDT